MRVLAAQLPGCTGNAEQDRATAEDAVRDAAAQGADLVLLPELALVPYFAGEPAGSWDAAAETVGGPSVRHFAVLARELGVAIALPFFERDDATGARYNSVVVLDRHGEVVAAVARDGASRPTARKLHLPASPEPPPGCDEPAHFTPGEGLGVHTVDGVRLGVLVCYDRRFPECWRELRAAGATTVLVPIAGSGGDDPDFVLGEMRTHARENGLAVLAAGKVGDERLPSGVVENEGGSLVLAADGAVLGHRSREQGPGAVVASLDADDVHRTRRRLRYFHHRRTDLFGGPTPDRLPEAQ